MEIYKLKKCFTCNVTKDLSEFNKCKKNSDGLRGDCRSCQAEYRKKHYLANREYQLEQGRRWKEENYQQVLDYASQWKRDNRERATLNENRRRAHQLNATVLEGDEWNDFIIEELYELRSVRSSETEIVWHVDHIIPLQGKTVCGFHIWYNLRLLPAQLNFEKGNRFEE